MKDQLALQFEPDSMVQLAVGLVRQIPLAHLEKAQAEATDTGEIPFRRYNVVANLLALKRSLIALDEAMGFNPHRWERP